MLLVSLRHKSHLCQSVRNVALAGMVVMRSDTVVAGKEVTLRGETIAKWRVRG